MKNLSITKRIILFLIAFLFYPALHAQVNPGDLVITEIMNNPSAVSDAAGEWFEVYNTTASPINMMGMTIRDDDFDNHVIASSLVIPAGGYVVLGNNSDLATNGGTPVDYEYGSGWYIANSADEVIIETDGATLIDQVFYDGGIAFPDPNGASMSLDPTLLNAADNDIGTNWCEAYYVYGAGDKGTPGNENLPCTTINPGDLVITEIMNNPSAVLDENGEWFEVYNTTAFPINMMGMIIRDDDFDNHVIASSLVVPAGGYVVLGNNSDLATNGGTPVDYEYGSGWYIANSADEVIIETDGATLIDQVFYDGGIAFPDPNGASMSLDPTLLNAADNDIGTNWCEAYYVYGAGDKGTPGNENLPCTTINPGDLVITEIMNNPSAVLDENGEWFEVYNTTAFPINMMGMIIRDDDFDNHVIASSLVVPAGGYVVLGNNSDLATNGGTPVDYEYGSGWYISNSADEVIIEIDGATLIDQVFYDGGIAFPDPNGASMSLDPTLLNASDNDFGENWCEAYYVYGAGDKGTPGNINLPCSINPGDLVITEIMNNPFAVLDENGEWFEVYNTTEFSINMMGMTIRDDDIDYHVIASSLLVPAGGYAVLGNNSDLATNGGTPVDYEYGSGWYISNSADEVIIETDGATLIDQVFYDGGITFPDPNGASMSLDPTLLNAADNDIGTNWCESYYVYGAGDKGTPGNENLPCIINNPPVAICQDVTVPAKEDCLATVTAEQVDNGSYDPDGDPVIIEISPEGLFELGDTEVTLTITDDSGETDQCLAIITVIDSENPVLDVVTVPLILWPPNHKYETIDLEQLFVSVSDNCAMLTMEDVYITSVSSDEEENATGNGDGNTMNDILIGDDCQSVKLRRERNGNGNGRVYTIHLAVDDGNGNNVDAICQVHVPKNSNQSATDDGAVYSAGCNKSSLVTNDSSINDNLLKNYPNPFNRYTTVNFSVVKTGNTSLIVYNSAGTEMATLYVGIAEAGFQYTVEFDGSSLPKGIYFCQLQTADGETITEKMILME